MKHVKFLPLMLIGFIILSFGGAALAASSTSTPGAGASLAPDNKFVMKHQAAPPYLHIYTNDTTGSVQQALTDYGITFDTFSGANWSSIDLS